MELKGKMDLVVVYKYCNTKFDRTITNEEQLKDFINELLQGTREDLEQGYNNDFEILEIINNLGY